jgi:Sulfotransferase family
VSTTSTERPIIVLGCPRSGTTLMQIMLHSHRRIAIPPETRFVLPVYRRRLRFGDLEQAANRRRLARFIVRGRGRRFFDLGLDERETIRRIVAGPPTLGSALAIVFQAYAERFGRSRWGDKRPAYYAYLDVVMRLFPDAQIVSLVRDPRDCVASLKQMPWWKRDSYHSVLAWAQAIDFTDEAARTWPGAVMRVQYERLVTDPERELTVLCAALGETYDRAMAEPEQLAAVAVPERKYWHENTRTRPRDHRIGRWEADLEPWEVGLCETVLAERMERYGYELSGAGRPRADRLLRYAQVKARVSMARKTRLLKDRLDQRREPNPVAAVRAGKRARRTVT